MTTAAVTLPHLRVNEFILNYTFYHYYLTNSVEQYSITNVVTNTNTVFIETCEYSAFDSFSIQNRHRNTK